MRTLTIHRRSFEALKHPKGSEARKRLNENAISSEYMPSYKYQVVGEHISNSYRTKKEAENFITERDQRD